MKLIRFILTYILHLIKLLNPATMIFGLWKDRQRVNIRIKLLISMFPSEPSELIVGFTLVLLGILFMTPLAVSSFATIIATVIPLWIFGIICMYIGFAQIYALFTICESGKKHSSLLAFLLWAFVTITVSISTVSIATVLFLMLVTTNAWIFYRAGRPKAAGMLRRKILNE